MKKLLKTVAHYLLVFVIMFVAYMTLRIGIAYFTGFDIQTMQPVVQVVDGPIDDGPVRYNVD